jgi:hypothetical protein
MKADYQLAHAQRTRSDARGRHLARYMNPRRLTLFRFQCVNGIDPCGSCGRDVGGEDRSH